MPIYILLSTLTQQGVQTLKANPERLLQVNRDIEELGVRVLHQWATLGEFDFVNVVDAPDIETIAKASALDRGARLRPHRDAARLSRSTSSSRISKESTKTPPKGQLSIAPARDRTPRPCATLASTNTHACWWIAPSASGPAGRCSSAPRRWPARSSTRCRSRSRAAAPTRSSSSPGTWSAGPSPARRRSSCSGSRAPLQLRDLGGVRRVHLDLGARERPGGIGLSGGAPARCCSSGPSRSAAGRWRWRFRG